MSDLVSLLADGGGFDAILADFPYLESDDLKAALAYAAQAVDHRVIQAA